jgi:2-isopropylmalate synthase
VSVLKQNGNQPVSEATVKMRVSSGDTNVPEHRVAEGDGPVNALDSALRQALKNHLPAIKDVHLVDYKVRVINSKDETAAAVRVVIESRRK